MLAVIFACFLALAASSSRAALVPTLRNLPPPWSVEKAWQWYNKTPWPVGANFIPSTASNELEMWQPATFDPATIDRELGWLAGKLKMNTVRVFLHVLPWFYQDATQSADASTQFLARIDQFLGIAAKHNVKTLFVLFDDCWDEFPKPGPQPAPIPHVHNSRWVTCPSLASLADRSSHETELKPYVVGIMSHFANDERVFGWDLYNEAGNSGRGDNSIFLVQEVFRWAREANVSQPITACLWNGPVDMTGNDIQSRINRIITAHSDVITFHNYLSLNDYVFSGNDTRIHTIVPLRKFGRPIICTEYMARPLGSTFEAILPYAKANKIGSINWGFVNGKTQTIYPWDSRDKNYTQPPAVWFHDILNPDGSPFDQKEVNLINDLILN